MPSIKNMASEVTPNMKLAAVATIAIAACLLFTWIVY